MLLTLAPMEGLTGAVFRRRHAEIFGGADRYYTPFVSPSPEAVFTDRHLKEFSPEVNRGLPVIPQILCKDADLFRRAALRLSELGYDEVNLNCGCPMGTVTAKGKGSGMLKTPVMLEAFFEEVFASPLPIKVSVKTRLGWNYEEEFDELLRIYSRFPISELVIHARVRNDFYKGDPRTECFEKALKTLPMPVGFNGDLVTVQQIRGWETAHPELASLMIGRAAVANPAIFRQAKGGAPASREELLRFHDALLSDYTAAFGSVNNTVSHMKQYWFYMKNLFEGGDKLFKNLLKTKRASDYETAVREITETLPMRTEPSFGWWKPAA